MSNSNLLKGGQSWGDTVPEGYSVGQGTFDDLAKKGPPDEVLLQLTFPGADKLGLPFIERDEAAIAAQMNDPRREGFDVYRNKAAVRLDRFVSELTANGFKFVDGHAFHKRDVFKGDVKVSKGRKDPTVSLFFSRKPGQVAKPMQDNIIDLLLLTVFDGFYLHANPHESGMRRDCINANPTTDKRAKQITYQLAFDGHTKGHYYLHDHPEVQPKATNDPAST